MSSWDIRHNSELKLMARQQLKGKRGFPILVCFLFCIITGAPSIIPYIGVIGTLILAGPMTLGKARFFLKFTRCESPSVETLFDGFKFFTSAFVLHLLIVIFTFLWTLLFIVPGIIAALRYSMAFYILNDNPGMSAMAALNQSKEMMEGHKGKLFLLGLSFIGWWILCILTLGIGFLWLTPYVELTMANFYEELKAGRRFSGAGTRDFNI